MTAGDVYDETMSRMKKLGIDSQIYSHPLGAQGHGLGASIDFRSAPRNESMSPAKKLRLGSYIAIELNTKSKVPEWVGEEVLMQEDPAYLTIDGWKFFVPLQEKLYVIPSLSRTCGASSGRGVGILLSPSLLPVRRRVDDRAAEL